MASFVLGPWTYLGPIGGRSARAGSILITSSFPINGRPASDLTSRPQPTAIPLISAQKNRLAGNVIWSDGTEQNQAQGSGKGGPSQKITEYSYTSVLLGGGVISGQDLGEQQSDFRPETPISGPHIDPRTGLVIPSSTRKPYATAGPDQKAR